MTTARKGYITKISGNMVTVSFDTYVMQNEVAYILHGTERLKSEIIRVRGNLAEMQVFESTAGLKIAEEVEFTGELLFFQYKEFNFSLNALGFFRALM